MIGRRNPSKGVSLVSWFVAACVAAGCAETPASLVGPSSTKPASTTEPRVTVTIAGRVTESVPTSHTGIEGATVTVDSVGSSGPSATTNQYGFFAISGVKPGLLTIRVAAERYVGASELVDVSADTTFTIRLMPKLETKQYTFPGEIDGKGGTCSDGLQMKPCLIFTFPIHNAGQVDATLSWTSRDAADLDLSLFQTGFTTAIARSASANAGPERVLATVTTGATYELRVTYGSGTSVAKFTLSFTQPN